MSLLGPIFTRTFTLLIITVVIKIQVLGGKCPSKEYSWCLQIDGYDSVILDGNRFHDIKHVFRQISGLFNDTNSKEFDQFLLFNNPVVQRLDENTFYDFTFKSIVIKNCTNLKRIDPEAFNGTKELITKVYIDIIGISSENVDDFFDSLNSLAKLEELELFNHNIITIPSYAFRQIRLTKLELDGPLDSIDNNAFFHLNNLRILKLYKSINHIKRHSFDFHLATDKTLDIYFDIKFNSIESGTFLHIQRPITLNLFLNKLTYLDEKVFGQILKSDIRHDIIFHGELKEIKNKCTLVWLFRNRDSFKGKFSFKTDPTITDSDFNNCQYNNNGQQQEPINVDKDEPSINSCPCVSLINRNMIAIFGSLYIVLFLFASYAHFY